MDAEIAFDATFNLTGQFRELDIIHTPLEIFQYSPPPLYFDGSRWYYLTADNRFHSISPRDLDVRLINWGLDSWAPPGGLSDCDHATIFLQDHHAVCYAGSVSGYPLGKHYLSDGSLILVTSETRPVGPVEGKWPMVKKLIHELFGEEQTVYILCWLKIFLTSFRATMSQGEVLEPPMAGQAVVLCGPANSGKSLFKKLIIEFFGSKSAQPFDHMLGQTSFNQELIEAPILEIDDEAASKDPRDRLQFGAKLKSFVANDLRRVNAKYQKPITLQACQRIIVCLNDEPNNLMVLPIVESSIEDKLFLFKVGKATIQMPTNTPELRAAYWRALTDELPAFAHFLLNAFEIPEALQEGRFGVKHFHNPELLEAIGELNREEEQTLEMLDHLFERNWFFVRIDPAEVRDLDPEGEHRRSRTEPWEGSAAQIEEILRSHFPKRGVDRLFRYNNSVGMLLSNLARKFPDRVKKSSTIRGTTRWIIEPPSETNRK